MWPEIIPDPSQARDLAFWQSKDKEKNLESSPPDGEFIDLHCIWAVEFYTPAHIASLLDGLSKLGWDKDDDRVGSDPISWIRGLRERSHGGGWLNLGPIVRPGDRRFLSSARQASLPFGIDYATGEIFSLTSSLTCIVIGFVFDEHRSKLFDRAIREPRETYFERHGRGYSIHQPENQKIEAIKSARASFRTDAYNWFRLNLPGLFSSSAGEGELPICEFVTLRSGSPFPHRGSQVKPQLYLHILDMRDAYEIWRSEDVDGLKFAWPLLRSSDNDVFHSVLVSKEDAFADEQIKAYGSTIRSRLFGFIDARIKGLLSRWALVSLITSLERGLNRVRDSGVFQQSQKRNLLPLLNAVSSLVSRGVNIAAVASELSSFANRPSSFLYEVHPFRAVDEKLYGGRKIALGERLREETTTRAGALGKLDKSVRDLMVQYSGVLAARENIKLQKSLGRLTWVLVILTIAVVLLTGILTYDPVTRFLGPGPQDLKPS
ncbi:MAG TPA: hypothetical protein VJN67_04780 [Stellaceae bacterium]|nr:hypothetical protein [Stellaceae bacterium]